MRVFFLSFFLIFTHSICSASMNAKLRTMNMLIEQVVESETYLVDGEFYFYAPNGIYLAKDQTVTLGVEFYFEYKGKTITAKNFKSQGISLYIEELGLVSHQEETDGPKVVDDHLEINFQIGKETGETKLLLAFEDSSDKSIAEYEFLIEIQEEDLLSSGGVTIIKMQKENPIMIKLIDSNGKISYQQLGFRDTIEVDPKEEYHLFIEIENWGEKDGISASEIIDFKNKEEASVDWAWKGKELSFKRVSKNKMFMMLHPKETGKIGQPLSTGLDIFTPTTPPQTWQKDVVDRYKGTHVNPSYLRLVRNKNTTSNINYQPLIITRNQKKKGSNFNQLKPKEIRSRRKAQRAFERKNKNAYQVLQLQTVKFNTYQLNNARLNKTKTKSNNSNLRISPAMSQAVLKNNSFVLLQTQKPKYKCYTLELLVKEEGRDFDVFKELIFKVTQ